MNKYSFWKLYLAQWSWKNECESALWYIGFILLVGAYSAFINDPYYPLVVHCLTTTLMIIIVAIAYQLIKSILMAFYCIYICNGANSGDLDFMIQYCNSMTWRKAE